MSGTRWWSPGDLLARLGHAVDSTVSHAIRADGEAPATEPETSSANPSPPAAAESAVLDVFRSMLRFSWRMSLFGVRQVRELLAPEDPNQPRATAAFDRVAGAAEKEMDGAVHRLFAAGERLQRGMVNLLFDGAGAAPPAPAGATGGAAPAAEPAPDSGRLRTAAFVVLGEGLAAGIGDFGLAGEVQRNSFPAVIARQMRTGFLQPDCQGAGIGEVFGFSRLPVRVPGLGQTTVLDPLPAGAGLGNLAVPGLRLADALRRRPAPPVVHRTDALQTAVNLILGLPAFRAGTEGPLPTQLEAALKRRPTLALVELGYAEALAAAVAGTPEALPAAGDWGADAGRLLAELRGAGAEVVALTVPDPLDTAYFSTLEAAARVVKVEPGALASAYALRADDRITIPGLVEIGGQLLAGNIQTLPAGSVLPAEAAQAVGERVERWNAALGEAARGAGALVYDLHGLLRRVRRDGVSHGPRTLTADFLGGFYGLNGTYPGQTGHALIANEILRLLNGAYGARFPLVAIDSVAAQDPVADQRQPGGPPRGDLAAMAAPPVPPPGRPPEPRQESRPAAAGGSGRLRLPAGLEQVLPLYKPASYHGDAIRIVNCRDDRDSQWGSCGELFFGGLVMFDSHLAGSIRIRFSPPNGDLTRFEVSHGNGLAGDDGVLAAPQLFRWPVREARVLDDPVLHSSGTLNLATGEVGDLQYYTRYVNSALFALASVNPGLNQPIAFPGQYGTAAVQFEQRPDGALDFTFHGTTFLPLGKELQGYPVRWALPFAGPSMQFASIPASGMVMHPHLHLTTKEPAGEQLGHDAAAVPEIPTNTVRELVLQARNSSLGDQFTLNAAELGGRATGRSQLMGRLQVQFGERFGDAVSVAVSCMSPGGLLAPALPTPVAAVFPGRLDQGPIGHDEFLRFPLRTYFLDGVAVLDDPFDISVGAVDVRTGRLIGGLLHRAFIGQDVFFALLRVEPRTPKSSFFFLGPADFEKGARGQAVFRFKGQVRIPYPEGFAFPAPDLATPIIAGADSVLDPYLWLQAVADDFTTAATKRGGGSNLRASTGEIFSYSYRLPSDPARQPAAFLYTNHSQDGTFLMHSLIWVSFANSLHSRARAGDHDTVTFAGFGTWSKDGGRVPHLATVQVAQTTAAPYVSIQIDGGQVSNVNIKPVNEEDALP